MEINATIWKTGNSYVISVPKALINCGVLRKGQKLKLKVEQVAKELEKAFFEILSRNL